ncbi:MAG: hypothetical protein KY391_05885 [Actinobacteria bacterium]|nr:hypothetical protein [Actinomycetota bacterium]
MERAGVFGLVALVVAALTFVVVNGDERSGETLNGNDVEIRSPEEPAGSPSVEESPTQDVAEVPPGFEPYRNRAGYSFAYPEAWNLDQRGTAVEILAPDASVAMSFGVAPSGDVRTGMGKLLDALEDRYDVQEVRGPSPATVGTTDGVSVMGEAINDDNVRIDFTAFVVDGGSGNYAITVFAAATVDAREIRTVLDSFTTL